MIRSIRSALVLVALAGALVIPSVASAATVEECQAEISALSSRTAESSFLSKQADKESTGLVGKLAGASEALALGKLEGAATKLTNYLDHVTKLAADGKVDADDGAALILGAGAAIACVASIEPALGS